MLCDRWVTGSYALKPFFAVILFLYLFFHLMKPRPHNCMWRKNTWKSIFSLLETLLSRPRPRAQISQVRREIISSNLTIWLLIYAVLISKSRDKATPWKSHGWQNRHCKRHLVRAMCIVGILLHWTLGRKRSNKPLPTLFWTPQSE